MDDFFEPNWETGRAMSWQIKRSDGEPMGVVSLRDQWTDSSNGEIVTSSTLLTVIADGHLGMGRFHRPGDEKRSVVVLEPGQFRSLLSTEMADAWTMLGRPDDDLLITNAARQVSQNVQGGLF